MDGRARLLPNVVVAALIVHGHPGLLEADVTVSDVWKTSARSCHSLMHHTKTPQFRA